MFNFYKEVRGGHFLRGGHERATRADFGVPRNLQGGAGWSLFSSHFVERNGLPNEKMTTLRLVVVVGHSKRLLLAEDAAVSIEFSECFNFYKEVRGGHALERAKY